MIYSECIRRRSCSFLRRLFVKSHFAGLEFRGPATQLRRANALRSHTRTVWLLLFFQHS